MINVRFYISKQNILCVYFYSEELYNIILVFIRNRTTVWDSIVPKLSKLLELEFCHAVEKQSWVGFSQSLPGSSCCLNI